MVERSPGSLDHRLFVAPWRIDFRNPKRKRGKSSLAYASGYGSEPKLTFNPNRETDMDRQPISRKGYDKIKAEIEKLEDDLHKVAEQIKSAREEGDLSENAAYHAQRETPGMLQAKAHQHALGFALTVALGVRGEAGS